MILKKSLIYLIDPNPDFITFQVVSPILNQLKYQIVIIIILAIIIYLTIRLIQRNRNLRVSNLALMMANKEIKKGQRFPRRAGKIEVRR